MDNNFSAVCVYVWNFWWNRNKKNKKETLKNIQLEKKEKFMIFIVFYSRGFSYQYKYVIPHWCLLKAG